MRSRRVLTSVLCLFLLVELAGCAARGPRNRTRVAAETVGECVIALDSTERALFAGNAYALDVHRRAGELIIKTAYAAQGFERAVAAWQTGEVEPSNVQVARRVIAAVLDELDLAIPPDSVGHKPFLTAVQAIRAAVLATGR